MESEIIHIKKLLGNLITIVDSHRESLSANEIETLDEIIECYFTQNNSKSGSSFKRFFSKDEIIEALALATRFLLRVFSEE